MFKWFWTIFSLGAPVILSFKTSSAFHLLHLLLSPAFRGKKNTDIGLTANDFSFFIDREVQKKKWSLGLMQFLNLHLLEADLQVNRYDSIYYLPVLGCSRFCIADKTGFLTTNVSINTFIEKLKTVLLLSFFFDGERCVCVCVCQAALLECESSGLTSVWRYDV